MFILVRMQTYGFNYDIERWSARDAWKMRMQQPCSNTLVCRTPFFNVAVGFADPHIRPTAPAPAAQGAAPLPPPVNDASLSGMILIAGRPPHRVDLQRYNANIDHFMHDLWSDEDDAAWADVEYSICMDHSAHSCCN